MNRSLLKLYFPFGHGSNSDGAPTWISQGFSTGAITAKEWKRASKEEKFRKENTTLPVRRVICRSSACEFIWAENRPGACDCGIAFNGLPLNFMRQVCLKKAIKKAQKHHLRIEQCKQHFLCALGFYDSLFRKC